MFNVGQAYRQSKKAKEVGEELNRVNGMLKMMEQNLSAVYAGEDAQILESYIQTLVDEIKDIGKEAARIGELIESEAAALQREIEEAQRRRNQLKKSQNIARSR